MLGQQQDKARLLIVDDEPSVRRVLLALFESNYECVEAPSAEEALNLLRSDAFNLVLSDVNMKGISGLEMIPKVAALAPDAVVIMISGQQNIECAVQAMRAGAFDFITKPFDFDYVEAVVRRALKHQSLQRTKMIYENHLEELVAARTAELRREMVERLRAEEKINRVAYYDGLTNLPNPALFKDRLAHELSKSASAGADGSRKMSAVVFLALDRFKNIGDTLGLHVADEILRGFAERLSKCIRKSDTAAYFGGSEFALLATDVDAAEDCAKIAQKIKNSLLAPFSAGGRELHVTASFGISLAPNDADDCQTLLKNASTALHRARGEGGGAYRFYTPDMHDRALKSLSLENNLRSALETEQFVLYYQPQICAASGKLIGAEALVRWRHPELGTVSPLDFIPIAEATGLIVPLGDWILETACAQNARWHAAGFPPLRIAVNLSLRQFQQSNLVETVSRVLKSSGLAAQHLELELTESVLMENSEATIDMLNRLRNLGVRISVDDFGSGYSSLAYLKNLPIDVLKIDRTFVADIAGDDSRSRAIVLTIVTLARSLGLKTVAEGVETEAQSVILRALGCDEMQGFFFGKPLAPAELESFLSGSSQLQAFNKLNRAPPVEMRLNA